MVISTSSQCKKFAALKSSTTDENEQLIMASKTSSSGHRGYQIKLNNENCHGSKGSKPGQFREEETILESNGSRINGCREIVLHCRKSSVALRKI